LGHDLSLSSRRGTKQEDPLPGAEPKLVHALEAIAYSLSPRGRDEAGQESVLFTPEPKHHGIVAAKRSI
jgi:hypothetical protein